MSARDAVRRLSATVKAVSVSLAVSGGLAAGNAAGKVPDEIARRSVLVLTGVLAVLGVVYGARLVVHVRLGYLGRVSGDDEAAKARRNVRRLTLLDALLVASWAALVTALFLHPSPLLLLAGLTAIRLVVPWLAGLTADCLVQVPHLERATEALDHCWLVKAVKRGARGASPDAVYDPLMEWWDGKRTPVHTKSAHVHAVVFVLVAGIAATVPMAVAEATRLVADSIAVEVGSPQASASPSPPAAAKTVSPSVATVAPTEEPAPSRTPSGYVRDCGGAVPGTGAPGAFAEGLRALWMGSDTVPGAGATAAGCGGRAFEEPGQPDVWLVMGMCGSELRTLGVAAAGKEPVLLYQEAARIAYDLATRGELRGASARFSVGGGDGYLLHTVGGTRVLVRRATSHGKVTPPAGGPRCSRQTTRAVRYVELPIALAPLWVQAMELEGAWLWPSYDLTNTAAGKSYVFTRADGRDVVARAVCDGGECAVTIRGRELRRRGGRFVELDEVRLHGGVG